MTNTNKSVDELNTNLSNLSSKLSDLTDFLSVKCAYPTVWNETVIQANGYIKIYKIGDFALMVGNLTTLAKVEKSGCLLTIPSGYGGAFSNAPCKVFTNDASKGVFGVYTTSSDGYTHLFTNNELAAGYNLEIIIPYKIA